MLMEAIVASVIAGTSVCSDHFDNVSRFQPQELSEYQQCVYIVHEKNSGVVGKNAWFYVAGEFVYVPIQDLQTMTNDEVVDKIVDKIVEKRTESNTRAVELIETFIDNNPDADVEMVRQMVANILNIDVNDIIVPSFDIPSYSHLNIEVAEILTYTYGTGPGNTTTYILNGVAYESVAHLMAALPEGTVVHDPSGGYHIATGGEIQREPDGFGGYYYRGGHINIESSDQLPVNLIIADQIRAVIPASMLNEIQSLINEAYTQGYDDGYRDGYVDGYADGFRDGVAAARGN